MSSLRIGDCCICHPNTSDGVVKAAHDRGLLVQGWHAYITFPPKGITAAGYASYLLDGIGLDGLFTEYPGVARGIDCTVA